MWTYRKPTQTPQDPGTGLGHAQTRTHRPGTCSGTPAAQPQRRRPSRRAGPSAVPWSLGRARTPRLPGNTPARGRHTVQMLGAWREGLPVTFADGCGGGCLLGRWGALSHWAPVPPGPARFPCGPRLPPRGGAGWWWLLPILAPRRTGHGGGSLRSCGQAWSAPTSLPCAPLPLSSASLCSRAGGLEPVPENPRCRAGASVPCIRVLGEGELGEAGGARDPWGQLAGLQGPSPPRRPHLCPWRPEGWRRAESRPGGQDILLAGHRTPGRRFPAPVKATGGQGHRGLRLTGSEMAGALRASPSCFQQ